MNIPPIGYKFSEWCIYNNLSDAIWTKEHITHRKISHMILQCRHQNHFLTMTAVFTLDDQNGWWHVPARIFHAKELKMVNDDYVVNNIRFIMDNFFV